MGDQIFSRMGQFGMMAIFSIVGVILGAWGVWPSTEPIVFPVIIRFLLVISFGGLSYLGVWHFLLYSQKTSEDELSFKQKWGRRSFIITMLAILFILVYIVIDSIEFTSLPQSEIATSQAITPSPTSIPEVEQSTEEPPKIGWPTVIVAALVIFVIVGNIKESVEKTKKEEALKIQEKLEIATVLSRYRTRGKRIIGTGIENIHDEDYSDWLENRGVWRLDLESYVQINLDSKFHSKLVDLSNLIPVPQRDRREKMSDAHEEKLTEINSVIQNLDRIIKSLRGIGDE